MIKKQSMTRQAMTLALYAYVEHLPECPKCGALKGSPCTVRGARLLRPHRERVGFNVSRFRVGLLRAEKALLEKMLCDCRKNELQHYRDELWAVNEALRFAAKGEGHEVHT